MKNTKKAQWAKANAEKVIMISVEEARNLPNMLGKIVPMALKLDGWYAHTSEGKIIYYEAV